jgi:hypothetical protein
MMERMACSSAGLNARKALLSGEEEGVHAMANKQSKKGYFNMSPKNGVPATITKDKVDEVDVIEQPHLCQGAGAMLAGMNGPKT